MQQVHFIDINNSRIAYHVFGRGKLPVFCLHGFSLSGAAYAALGKLCPEEKVMFALDFPLHGQTDWKEAHLTANDMLEIFQQIAEKELASKPEHFELMGHSMGGRIALYMYQCFAGQISKLILMAPDGLKPSIWQRFLFKTRVGPVFFRRMTHSAKRITSLARFARRIRIIKKSVYNLIKSSYEDEAVAYLVYERLMATQDFYPDISLVKKALLQYQTPVYLFFGKYDSIVPAGLGKYLQKGAASRVHIQILHSGHLILTNEEALADLALAMDA